MEKDHLQIILEEMNSKFNLVLEGHSTLQASIDRLEKRTDERFDLVDLKFSALSHRIDNLETMVDGIATDLKAHRADTEAHGGIYRVKEN